MEAVYRYQRKASEEGANPRQPLARVGVEIMTETTKRKAGRPKGPCSPREIEQRRQAAPAAARARSPAGTRASSRNRWVHGRYAKGQLAAMGGKPCRTTCPKYPCVFVTEEKTKPGQSCLEAVDVSRLEHVAEAVLQAVDGGDASALNQIASLEMAGNLDILHRLRSEIAARGVLIERTLFDKSGKKISVDVVENPALKILVKLCSEMGINLTEFVATPAAKAKIKGEEEERETAAAISRRLMSRLGPLSMQSKPVDAEIIEDDEASS